MHIQELDIIQTVVGQHKIRLCHHPVHGHPCTRLARTASGLHSLLIAQNEAWFLRYLPYLAVIPRLFDKVNSLGMTAKVFG